MNLSLLSQESKKNKVYWGAALSSGVVLWLAWPPMPLAFLIFAGFVPLFWLAEKIITEEEGKVRHFSRYIFGGLLVWNLLTTYWIYNATIGGAAFAIVANAFLMTIPWFLFGWILKKHGRWPAYPAFILFWLSFEHVHLNWELAWPWLNLGNVFSLFPGWVQWYEYTGAPGGTLWVLIVNILLYRLVAQYKKVKDATADVLIRKMQYSGGTLLLFLIFPFVLSAIVSGSVELQETKKVRTAVIQPNVDPYEEKFEETSREKQLSILLDLSRQSADEGAELLIWPETSLPENVRLENFKQYQTVGQIKSFLEEHPEIHLITGATTFESYSSIEEKTATARPFRGRNEWYDVYNSAIYWDGQDDFQFYHKSILVPGVERMPYPEYLGILEQFAIDVGGIGGSMGTQANPSLFNIDENLSVAPVICYESVFGEYTGRFVRKGANMIVIITNDGWWGDTEGYRQHFHYASLRAIETRRSIARSANTGISGFFDPMGNAYDVTGFWVKDQRVRDVTLNDELTFYVKHGDFIGRISFFTSILLIIGLLVKIFLKSGNKYNSLHC